MPKPAENAVKRVTVSKVMRSSYDFEELNYLLKLWGRCIETIHNWSGYPSSDPTYRMIYGRGNGREGIPIPDMPKAVVQMSCRINKLPEPLANAITVRYAYNLSPNGWWGEEQKAQALGISIDCYRARLRRAKKKLLKLSHQSVVLR